MAERYREKSKSDGLALRVTTAFGSKLYRLSDGLTVVAVRPDGSETDITAAVLRTDVYKRQIWSKMGTV